MQTVKNIRQRAIQDLRQRIFQKSIFRHKHMKDMAKALAREYSAGMSPENLLALSRHDTWLSGRTSRGKCQNVGRIETELFNYLKTQLRILVEGFWEGRTSVELVVESSGAKLAGFFNGQRPRRQDAGNSVHDDAHKRTQSPYA